MFEDIFEESVNKAINTVGAVYTDDIISDTHQSKELITRWLKKNGFVKTGGCKSKRWVNELRRSNG
jgi:hypothetical protein